MKSSKKALLLTIATIAVLAALAVSGEFLVANILENSFSIHPNSSIVYIVNGVSGVVTIKDPSLNKTVTIDIDYNPLASGSGVIVTKDGYIITAFHVIGDPQTLENQHELKKMSNNEINQYIEQAAVEEYISNYNPQLGKELLNNTSPANFQEKTDLLTSLLIKNNLINVDLSKQVIKVKISSYNNLISNYLNAQLVDVGNPNNVEDVALLKVNYTNNNLPALNISSNNPSLGENVRIYGYPGNQNSIKLASTNGSIINKIVNNQGIVYYETNAPIANGYSGGPTLDNKNRVLGIVIYGIQTRGHFNSQTRSDYSLFLSSDYLIQICNKNNIPIKIS